jgi:hypothetical protein
VPHLRWKAIRDDGLRATVAHLAFVIDGTPEIAAFAIDPHEQLVDMPTPVDRGEA